MRLIRFIFLSLILMSTQAIAQDSDPIKGEFIIEKSKSSLKTDILLESVSEATRNKFGIKKEGSHVMLLSTKSAGSYNLCDRVDRYMRALRRDGGSSIIRRVECSENERLSIAATPNDSQFSQLWGMHQSNNVDIDATQAWDMTTGSEHVIVGIIDSGVDYTHPDLAANMWVNSQEIPGNGIDDDGNGFVDDIHGINAITRSGNPMDDHGHGTHCAGTIGGVGNNSIGVAGVNWRVKMIGLKFLSASGGGNTYDAIIALDYLTALKNRGENIALSNNSWGGGGYSSALYSAIQRSRQAGILFVAAAGNSGLNADTSPMYPAAYNLDNIISVGAIDRSGNKASFSNYGLSNVDIGAPGVSIRSTLPGNSYASWSGTSMAAPHVAGAIALLKGYNQLLNWQQLRDILYSSARSFPNLSGYWNQGKVVNVYNMLQAVDPDQTPAPTNTPLPSATPTPTKTPTPIPATPTPTSSPTPVPPFNGSMTVTTQDLNGSPISGAMVEVFLNNQSSASHSMMSSADGKVSFTSVSGPNSYRIKVTKPGYSFVDLYGNLQPTQNIVRIGSIKFASVAVRVIDEQSGAGLSGIVVDFGSASANTDATGYASIQLPVGSKYKIRLSDGYFLFRKRSFEGVVHGDLQRSAIAY